MATGLNKERIVLLMEHATWSGELMESRRGKGAWSGNAAGRESINNQKRHTKQLNAGVLLLIGSGQVGGVEVLGWVVVGGGV